MPDWRDFQDAVAEFFRSLGLEATTDETIVGVRTTHEVDVAVRSRTAGLETLWIIECKLWKTAVPKEKVLALRSIVDDVGADRGILVAESGYQSGALEAARFANVQLTSLTDLRETAVFDFGMANLRSLLLRVETCRQAYWAIDKYDRIDSGLRPEVGAFGYAGDVVLRAVQNALLRGIVGGFPLVYDRTTEALSYFCSSDGPVSPETPGAILDPSQLFDVLDEEVRELERRLSRARGSVDPE